MSSPSICAIIPARGGSKGLLRKNLQLLDGIPLIAHTILAARGSAFVHSAVVTTEDPEIHRVSLEYGAQVIDRPAHLATDLSLVEDVVAHALGQLAARSGLPDYFALLQPTSPLRTAAHLDRCIEGLLRSDASCAISVTEAEHHPFKAFFLDRGKLKPLHERRSLHQPRQALPPVVRQNGAIYVLGTKRFLQERSFYVEPAIPFFMNAEDSVDIDSAFDLRVAELLTRPRPPAEAVAAGKCDA